MRRLKNRCFASLVTLGATLAPCVFTVPPSQAAQSADVQPSQQVDLKQAAQELRRVIDDMRKSGFNTAGLRAAEQKYGEALLPELERYTTDPNTMVVGQAYGSMFQLARDATNAGVRRRIIEQPIKDLRDHDGEGTRATIVRNLFEYRAADFSDKAKADLHEMLSLPNDKRYAPIYASLLLLAGMADMKSELPHLQKIIDGEQENDKASYQRRVDEVNEQIATISGHDPPRSLIEAKESIQKKTYWQETLLWNAMRARAHMGVKEDIQRCLEMVESHPDPNYRSEVLFGQLAYIRQPEVVEYLRKYLDSDRPPPYKGWDVITASEAQCAGAALAEMLENWPLKDPLERNASPPFRRALRILRLSNDGLVTARKWMAEQKEWKIIR